MRRFTKAQFGLVLALAAATAVFLAAFFIFSSPIFAQGLTPLEQFGEVTQLGKLDIRIIIAKIVRAFLGLLGIVAVLLIIYGGWLYMTAAGDSEKISKAKQVLINTVIGLAIILASYGIVQFVIVKLRTAILGETQQAAIPPYISEPLSGSLGAGPIQSHFPSRGEKVCRNVNIAVTFKEKMGAFSVISDADGNNQLGSAGDLIKPEAVKIIKTEDLKAENEVYVTQVKARISLDQKIFIFDPQEYLGSSDAPVSYTVKLTDKIKKNDGSPVFTGQFSDGYEWEFLVNPCVDETPPQITSVIPLPPLAGLEPAFAPNIIVQINFNEAIDPSSASNAAIGLASATPLQPTPGEFIITNQYKTVEFIPNYLCGKNSCGHDVFCLPFSQTLQAVVYAATLSAAGSPQSSFPYTGIVDMYGNSLDGNKNDTAQGPQTQSGKPPYNLNFNQADAAAQGDDVQWQFKTSSNPDLTSPKILSVEPAVGIGNVDTKADIAITFSKLMMSSTLTNENVSLTHNVPANLNPPFALWYTIGSENIAGSQTKAKILHGGLMPSPEPPASGYLFWPGADSEIKDIFQNCFYPKAGEPLANPSCNMTTDKPYCCPAVGDAASLQQQTGKCAELP